MSYDVAQDIIDGKVTSDWSGCRPEIVSPPLGPFNGTKVSDIAADVHNLHAISLCLRKAREEVFYS